MMSDRSDSFAMLALATGHLPQPWLENSSITDGRTECSGTFRPPFCAKAEGATAKATAANMKWREIGFIPTGYLAAAQTYESRRRDPSSQTPHGPGTCANYPRASSLNT